MLLSEFPSSDESGGKSCREVGLAEGNEENEEG